MKEQETEPAFCVGSPILDNRKENLVGRACQQLETTINNLKTVSLCTYTT